MSEMIHAFQNLINPQAFIAIADEPRQLILKESGSQSTIETLDIKNIPAGAFAFTLDNPKIHKQLSCYLDVSNGIGINRSCDLVVIWPQDNNLHVLLLELKSEKPDLKDTQIQLDNSELFVRYILSLLTHFYHHQPNLQFHQAVITTDIRHNAKAPTFGPNRRKFLIKSVKANSRRAEALFEKLI